MAVLEQVTSQQAIELENKHGAHNYHPLPVVLSRGEGVYVWDVEGKKYYDFLSAYSAVNQGHCHPKIVNAMVTQAKTLSLTSRAFYNDVLGTYEKYVTKYFGFDKVLPMNTGAEAVETALKLCRKWAYEVKGIDENKAEIIVCENNFHGRTTTIISFSNDPVARKNFGPYTNGFIKIEYDNLIALKEVLENNKNVSGFLVEPIQGEAGVYVPSEGYLAGAKALCEEYGVLFIADEVQTGIARTGRLLATCGNCSCEDKNCSGTPDVKPDILILGKALSGGAYPVSAVLANNSIMNVIKPGNHGSTFGGNPLAMTVGNSVMDIILNKKFLKNVKSISEYFLSNLNKIHNEYPNIIKEIRGRGVLIGIQLKVDQTKFIKKLMDNNLLTIRAAENVVRILPPLNVKKSEINQSLKIIKKVCSELN